MWTKLNGGETARTLARTVAAQATNRRILFNLEGWLRQVVNVPCIRIHLNPCLLGKGATAGEIQFAIRQINLVDVAASSRQGQDAGSPLIDAVRRRVTNYP